MADKLKGSYLDFRAWLKLAAHGWDQPNDVTLQRNLELQ